MPFPFNTARFSAGAAIAGYTATAASYDGSASFVDTAGLSGAADSQRLTFSTWFKLDAASDSATKYFFAVNGSGSGGIFIHKTSGNVLRISGFNAAGTKVLDLETSGTYTSGATWHHLLIGVDLSVAGRRHIYVDDAEDTTEFTFTVGETFDLDGSCSIGSNGFSSILAGCLSDTFYDTARAWTDFTVAANRRLFDNGSSPLKPVDLTPILPALIWHKMNSGNMTANSGTGGAFTIHGSFSACSSAP